MLGQILPLGTVERKQFGRQRSSVPNYRSKNGHLRTSKSKGLSSQPIIPTSPEKISYNGIALACFIQYK